MVTSQYSLKQRILLVDDDLDILETLSLILKSKYEVIATTDAQQAVEHLTDIEPDLVILDAMMPIMSGYEAAEYIRKNKRYVEIPIVMLSALDSLQDHRTGYEHGVTLYLTKPFTPEILMKNVELELMKLGRPPQKKYSMDDLKKKFGHSSVRKK